MMRKQSLPPSFNSRSEYHLIRQFYISIWFSYPTRERKLTLPVMNLCQQHPNHQHLQNIRHQETSSVIPLYKVHNRKLTPHKQSSPINMNCVQCMTLTQVTRINNLINCDMNITYHSRITSQFSYHPHYHII